MSNLTNKNLGLSSSETVEDMKKQKDAVKNEKETFRK